MKINKKQNLKEVAYLKEINKERIKINEKLNNELENIIKKDEKLSNYELWINKKCAIFIQPKYIIEKVEKDLKKEGFAEDIVYVIMKKV